MSLPVDTVLTHFAEHGALPTTRYGRAYAHLTMLRKAHDAGTLGADDAARLAITGDWAKRGAPRGGRTGVNVVAIADRAHTVVEYVNVYGTLPKGQTPPYVALSYLRQRSDDLPTEVREQLDALPVEWRTHYRNSDQQFLDTLEAVAAWRVEYPKRWPRYTNRLYNEGHYASWLRTHRVPNVDAWRIEMLDARLPGWRDSGK